MSDPSELRCLLAERRREAGLSLTALAEQVGLSRQALSAIEAGRSVPSTATALRLAQALGCTVEALFQLPNALPYVLAPPGARLALGLVGDRWVAHPLEVGATEPADALAGPRGQIEPLVALSGLEHAALIAGCAPVLGVLAGQLGREGARWLTRSSGASLRALAAGEVHVAGLHLAARDEPEAHERLVRALLPGVDLRILSLVVWREGLALAPGNPLGLAGAQDLGRPGLRVARRPEGSGAAQVLAAALSEAGLAPTSLMGPDVATHHDAAQALRFGAADAAVVIEPVAEAFGLPFLPLREERFELVVRAEHLDHPGVSALFEQLLSARFAREVGGMGAYDLQGVGNLRPVGAS